MPSGRRLDVLLAALLVVATCLAFLPAIDHDFVNYDDPTYVTENPHVLAGLSGDGVAWALAEKTRASNWHPLTWLSHMLDVELFGLAAGGHHGTSVLLHGLNAVLLFAARRRSGIATWPAYLVAALFAWHPLRVESVAWVSERKDVLAGTFFFLTLLFYAGYARAPTVGRYLLVALAFALGLAAKPMLVTVPFVLLLLDSWPLGRGLSRRIVLEKVPLLALAAASVLLTLVAQAEAQSSLEALPFLLRAENALAAYWVYFRQSLIPTGLAVFYPHAHIVSETPYRALFLPAAAGLGLIVLSLAHAWRHRKAAPALLTGWLWFFGMAVPVIGLVQVGIQAHADRYTYLPAIGIALALVPGTGLLDARRPRWVRRAALAVPVVFLILTVRQVGVWSNSTTLFEHAGAVTDRNYVAHNQLALALDERGRPEAARAELLAALAIHPDFPEALNNLGSLHFEAGELDEAHAVFQRALALAREDPVTNMNLGSVLLAQEKHAAARAAFERVRAAGEDGALLHYHLGLLAQAEGRLDDAERSYRDALVRDHDSGDSWNNLGQILLEQGRAPEAVDAYRQLVRVEPQNGIAHYALGLAFEANGELAEAAASLRRALELLPGLKPAEERIETLEGRSP